MTPLQMLEKTEARAMDTHFYAIGLIEHKSEVFNSLSLEPCCYKKIALDILLLILVVHCWPLYFLYARCRCMQLTHIPPVLNDYYFSDIFKCIFMNEKLCISIRNSLKFVPTGPNDCTSVLVQVMAWRQTGDKPLSEPIMTQFNDVYMPQ